LQSIERVRLELPIRFMIDGVVQDDVIDMQDGQTMKGLRGPLDGGPWRFRLRKATAAGGDVSNSASADKDRWPRFGSPIVSNKGVTGPNGSDPRPGVTAEIQAEVMMREQWEMLIEWMKERSTLDSNTTSGMVWTIEREEANEIVDRLLLGAARVVIDSRAATISFHAYPIELTNPQAENTWAVKLRFVAPESGEPVVVPAGEISVRSNEPKGWSLKGPFACDRKGAAIGVVAPLGESALPVDFDAPKVKSYAFITRANSLSKMISAAWNPDFIELPRPTVRGRIIDFGNVVWSHRLLKVEVPIEARRLLPLAASNPSDQFAVHSSEILLSISPSRFSPETLRSESGVFPMFGLNSYTDPDVATISAYVLGMKTISFKTVIANWDKSPSGLRTVTLEPMWQRTIYVQVRSQGQALDRALVIAIPANNDELKRHATAGTLPEFVAAVTKGYGTFDESNYTALPYPHVIPADPQGIPGHWVAAAVNGRGAAITWVPITQTEDVFLELGQVGTGVQTTVTATMPSLVGDSIPGANHARGMGWRGKLTYLLKAKAADEEHVRDLGQFTFGEDGRGQLMANLDRSVEWRFFLNQIPEAGVYLPLHDNVEVAALGPFKVRADPAGGDSPVVDLGNVPGPKMVIKHKGTDGLLSLNFQATVEGSAIFAKPAYAWANGHGCDTTKFIPPCVWDGKVATALKWDVPRKVGSQVIAEYSCSLDLPARASVLIVSNAAIEYELRVEGPWWFWGWRWEYTMPVEKGRRHRIWLPHGACKVTVSAKAEQGGAGGSPAAAPNQPRPKSITINVSDGWAGDHEIVMD